MKTGLIEQKHSSHFIERIGRWYVAAQAPLESTRTDVWELIWQLKTTNIVLLGPLKEGKTVSKMQPCVVAYLAVIHTYYTYIYIRMYIGCKCMDCVLQIRMYVVMYNGSSTFVQCGIMYNECYIQFYCII